MSDVVMSYLRLVYRRLQTASDIQFGCIQSVLAIGIWVSTLTLLGLSRCRSGVDLGLLG